MNDTLFIIFIILLIAGAVGYFVYDYYQKNSSNTPVIPLVPVTPPNPFQPLHQPAMVSYGDKVHIKNMKTGLLIGDCNRKDNRTDKCGILLSTTSGTPATFILGGGDKGDAIKSAFFTLTNADTGDMLHECIEAVGSGWGVNCVPITYSKDEKINFNFNTVHGDFRYGTPGHLVRDENDAFRVTLCKENELQEPCKYNVVFRAIYGDDWELWSFVKVD